MKGISSWRNRNRKEPLQPRCPSGFVPLNNRNRDRGDRSTAVPVHHYPIERALRFGFWLPLFQESDIEEGRFESVGTGLRGKHAVVADKLVDADSRKTGKRGREERSSLECGMLHRQSIREGLRPFAGNHNTFASRKGESAG